MKNLVLFLITLFVATACTKSETQYKNQGDKRHTVNDSRSDTIQTLTEVSDTLQNESINQKNKQK